MKITIKLTAKEKKLFKLWNPVALLVEYGSRLYLDGDDWGDGGDGRGFGVKFLKELKKQIDKIGEISKELDK